MRVLRFLLIKEFKQIFRNKALLPLMFVAPTLQLLVLPLAADFEIKNINIAIVDHDLSDFSRQLTKDITSSGYFQLVSHGQDYEKAYEGMEENVVDLVLEIPNGIENNWVRNKEASLLIAINAINGQDKQRPDVSDQCVNVPSWEQIKIHGEIKHWNRIDAHHVLVEMYRIFNILCHNS